MSQLYQYQQQPVMQGNMAVAQHYGQANINQNLRLAASIFPSVVKQLNSAGYMQFHEMSELVSMVNTNVATQNDLLTYVTNAFGPNAVSQAQMTNAMSTYAQRLLQYMRSQKQQQLPMNNGFGGFGMTQQPAATFVPFNQQQQPFANQQLDDMSLKYGANNQQNSNMLLNRTNQTRPGNTTRNPPPPEATVQCAKVERGKAFDITAGNSSSTLIAPKWERVKTNLATSSKLDHSRFQTTGDEYLIDYNGQRIKLSEIRMHYPFGSIEEVIADLYVSNPDILSGNFAYVVTYDKLVPLAMSYAESVKKFEVATSKYNEGSINDILEVIKYLRGEGNVFLNNMSDIILEQFNNYKSVNFIKTGERGVSGIVPFTSFELFTKFVTNSGEFDEWLVDYDSYSRALRVCISKSFGALFRAGTKSYLNINDATDRTLLLADPRVGFRFSTGHSGRTIQFAAKNESLNAELQLALNSVFPLLIEQKILLTNMKLPTVDKTNFGLVTLDSCVNKQLLQSIYSKYSSLDIVSFNDPQSFFHPLMLGYTYDQMVLRRK